MCCETPDCGGVETEEHLLFRCPRVRDIWSQLLPCWRRLAGRTIVWRDVLLGLHPQGSRFSSDQVDLVRLSWMVLCSVVLHHMWSTRNHWVFEERKLPPVQTSVKVILSVFASHLRCLERLWCTSIAKTQTFRGFSRICCVLSHMPVSIKTITCCCTSDYRRSYDVGIIPQYPRR